MLSAFGRAFRTPDLRRRLLFTLAIIGVFRIGSVLPGPGGVFTFALGLGLMLRNSAWAKRQYVRFKRRWPRPGGGTSGRPTSTRWNGRPCSRRVRRSTARRGLVR